MNMCDKKCKDDEKYCVPFEQTIEPRALARAYVPWQYFCSLFDAEESLINGTVFTELYQPYNKKPKNKKCK